MLRKKIGGSTGVAGHWVLGLELLECWSWSCWSAGVGISTVERSARI